MKKPIAILLIAVYLFNLGGYSFLFRYFIQQSDQTLNRQLDQNQYKEADLVEIGIPLHLPYMQNSGSSERIDGSIESNGIHYNFVKRRVTNDTLYIMCLPNAQKSRLINDKTSYGSAVNDFVPSKKQKESAAKKINLSAEYYNIVSRYRFVLPDVATDRLYDGLVLHLTTTKIDAPEHPPRHSS